MKLHPRLSRATVDLVTRFETFQPLAQPAAGGGWTVGYGHTRSARQGVKVSRADAEALLLYDLAAAADVVEAGLFAPVTQRQFEALTAFAFNIGSKNFRRSSALARINAGAELDAADEIERWRRAELGSGAQVVDALVRRRAAEKAHFLGLPEGFSKSPSAVLRPLAGAGGEGVEAGVSEAPAACATLTAANSVQARLRALVPDPVPEPQAPPFPATGMDAVPSATSDWAMTPPPTPPPANDQSAPLTPFVLAPGIEDAPPAHRLIEDAPPAGLADAVAEPELPGLGSFAAGYPVAPAAPEASAAPAAPTPAPPAPLPPPSPPPPPPLTVTPAEATPPDEAPMAQATPASDDTPPRRVGAGLSRRGLFVLLTVVGACLFVLATVLILQGKPGFGNLGVGVLGALLMTPGVYGLLGPRKPVQS